MASCNGEKYIAEQIESILNQTEQDWKLVIQDDCSTDGTFKIAEKYAQKYPDRIFAVQRKTPSGSAQNNFFSMLRFADSEYTMFCDDDDVWLPDKMKHVLTVMRSMETKWGTKTPILVHTDLKVVDANLEVISDSMFRRQNLDSRKCDLNQLLTQNNITGCTMIVNHTLVGTIVSAGIPAHAIVHDWWFALAAAACGKIGFVEQPEILYRQHTANEIGAQNARSFLYNLKQLSALSQVRQSLEATYRQAEEFGERFRLMLDPESVAMILDYSSIPHLTKLQKIHLLNTRGFWKTGLARKLGQLLLV